MSEIKTILIVDTEGTAKTPREIGAILFYLPEFTILQELSCLIPHESTSGIEFKTWRGSVNLRGRQKASLQLDNKTVGISLAMLHIMIENCDAILAHNVRHDKSVFKELDVKVDLKPWVCTVTEFIWPFRPFWMRRSLNFLCKQYKIDVKNRHRALDDCHLLLECVMRIPHVHKHIRDILDRQILVRKCAMHQMTRKLQLLETSVVKPNA